MNKDDKLQRLNDLNYKPNWVALYIYLLPFRRLICLLKNHDWVYSHNNSDDNFERSCWRCGKAEASFIIDSDFMKVVNNAKD
jgi:hypothetical protein